MHLFVCNLNAQGCFELHTETENDVSSISVIFSLQSWQVCISIKNMKINLKTLKKKSVYVMTEQLI